MIPIPTTIKTKSSCFSNVSSFFSTRGNLLHYLWNDFADVRRFGAPFPHDPIDAIALRVAEQSSAPDVVIDGLLRAHLRSSAKALVKSRDARRQAAVSLLPEIKERMESSSSP